VRDLRKPKAEDLKDLTHDQLVKRWEKWYTWLKELRYRCAVCLRVVMPDELLKSKYDPCNAYKCSHLCANELARRRDRARKVKAAGQTSLW